MGWIGHPIFLRRQFQFLENWWNMKHIHSISIWSSEIWPVLASSCQVRWPCCPLLSMAARKQPTSKAARFQRLLTGCAGWRLIAIIHYYSDDLSGTQFQRRTFPLQLTLTFLNTQKWSHPKPTSTICHPGLQPLRGGENLVFDPGRTQRRSAQGRRAVSAMCNVELPNNAGKTLENPGNSTQNLGCVVVSSVFIFWVVVGKNSKIIQ